MLITSKEAALLSLMIFGFCSLKEVSCDKNDAFSRDKKHFSLFSVVTFKNEECSSESTFNGGVVTGTCYTSTECSDKAGSKSGNCASGFGVCCIFIYNQLVATTINENRTYIENPLFPNVETSGAGTATVFTIAKMQSDICQVRLDFEEFVIAGPGGTGEAGVALADGNCNDKWATVLTGGAKVPTFCGVMTGMHVYMDLGMDAADTAAITLTLAGTAIATAGVDGITVANAFRKYRVKTSQIPCWADYRAPEGCHLYFTQITGQIVSPNFGVLAAGAQGNNLLNSGIDLMNQYLRHCIRRELGHCCVLYQVCNQFDGTALATPVIGGGNVANGEAGIVSSGWSFHSFTVGAGFAANKAAASNDIGLTDAACTTDYLEIPDSTTGLKSYGANVPVNTRYCGHRLGQIPVIASAGLNNHAPIWDCTEPFEANYFTDMFNDAGAQAIATPPNGLVTLRGLCLDFRQDAC